jgi:hypothetical protein
MPKGTIDIVVEPGLVRVNFDTISTFPHKRFYVGLACLVFIVVADCAIFFSGGKHGATSLWQDMHAYPIDSSRILFPLAIIVIPSVLLCWHISRVVAIAYPGAEKLECNRTTLTISRIRWLDWENKDWISESYQLNDVSRLRFGVIVSGRGNSTYGLLFRAAGRNYRLFPKLTTHEVGKILAGLEALGADTDRLRKARQRELKKRKVRA